MERKRTRESELHSVETLDELIHFAQMRQGKRAKTSDGLRSLAKPLEKLRDMVGLESVKQNIISQIMYFMQGLHDGKLDMIHTVIQGPPGVGKTELAKILGEIYTSMGILRSGRFVVARRSDLIGKYLGHTADKTQSVINKSRGGVLLIDEAYSLGSNGEGDSFSKECIDTLNQNLTDNKHNFMCIIAGYEKALNDCFFSVNEGLQRRFTFRYTLSPYTPTELCEIFKRMIHKDGWELSSDFAGPTFFSKNIVEFPHSAGDMETLLFQSKLAHASRLTDKKRLLTPQDVEKGLKRMKEGRAAREKDVSKMMMYL